MMKCKGDCLFNIDGKCTRQSKKDMTVIGKWKNDFKRFISELSMPEDDFYGIMQYIDEAPNETEWIPVSERLPEVEYGESDSVLVCFENETQDVLYFNGGNWCYPTGETYISVNHENGWHNKVTAWMPLPKAYESQESGDKE